MTKKKFEKQTPKRRRRALSPLPPASDDDNDDSDVDKDDVDDEDMEKCAGCGGQGEVLVCDGEGCDLVWHVACVPGLNGKMPTEDVWECPQCADDGLERCFACNGRGEVIVCEEPGCEKMFHLSCVPGLSKVS